MKSLKMWLTPFIEVCLLSTFLTSKPTLAADLEPLWAVGRGGREVGGCDNDLDNLKQGYTEAITLAEDAINALKYIQKPSQYHDVDELSLDDYQPEIDRWARRARLAKTMFGINARPETGVEPGPSTNRLEFAIGKDMRFWLKFFC